MISVIRSRLFNTAEQKMLELACGFQLECSFIKNTFRIHSSLLTVLFPWLQLAIFSFATSSFNPG